MRKNLKVIDKYIQTLTKEKNDLEILELIPTDREETIKAFEEFEKLILNYKYIF